MVDYSYAHIEVDESCLLMKVKIVEEVIACDVSPVAMFSIDVLCHLCEGYI